MNWEGIKQNLNSKIYIYYMIFAMYRTLYYKNEGTLFFKKCGNSVLLLKIEYAAFVYTHENNTKFFVVKWKLWNLKMIFCGLFCMKYFRIKIIASWKKDYWLKMYIYVIKRTTNFCLKFIFIKDNDFCTSIWLIDA